MSASSPIFSGLSRSTFDESNPSPYTDGVQKGVSEALVRRISADKKEPAWMLAHRLESLKIYHEKPLPLLGADLSALDLDDIIYYASFAPLRTGGPPHDWAEVPGESRKVYYRLRIPPSG